MVLAPVRRLPRAVRGPAGISLLAGSFAVAMRLLFVHDVPYPDEGGLLVVATHWHTGGPFLYGRLFVDRPPLLLLFFRLAVLLGGLVALRLLGLALVAVAVVLAARAGALLGGNRGAAGAALVCGALLSDPRLGTREMDAETVGIPLVLLSALLALEAVRRRPATPRALLLTASGAAGASALLVKQNLADGLVFAGVLVVATGLGGGRRERVARPGRVGWVLLGATIPFLAGVAWSTASTGARGLWYALYGFRLAASATLFGTTSTAQLVRLQDLGLSALVSGLAVLAVAALLTLLRHRPDAPTVALVAMLATELAGAAGGGDYWSHYLIGLVPATSLLVARALRDVRRPWLLQLLVAATLASSALATATAYLGQAPPEQKETAALTTWLDRAARPGDSAVVLYGGAPVFATTGLRPAYPFLWTLPQRLLDPHLTRLVRCLERATGPTFVVVRTPLDSWGLDPHGRLRHLIVRDYRAAARVDGDEIYVRRSRANTTTPATRRTTATTTKGHGLHSSPQLWPPSE